MKFIYNLIQWTWGIFQTFIGLIIYKKVNKKAKKQFKYKGSTVTIFGNNWGGVSLGKFIFYASGYSESYRDKTLKHEYGHTIQSLILGPLYLIVIGIPSTIWCICLRKYRKKNKINYYSFWCEAWADKLGKVKR